MDDIISFQILGNPKAQQRHRTYTKGKGGRPLPFARNVDPSATDKADMLAQLMQHRPEAPWTGPVQLWIVCVMPRPQHHYHTGKCAGELRADAPIYCDKKPDWDNCGKLVSDAMSGVFYKDDSQIADGRVVTRYDPVPECPRTEVTLRKL